MGINVDGYKNGRLNRGLRFAPLKMSLVKQIPLAVQGR